MKDVLFGRFKEFVFTFLTLTTVVEHMQNAEELPGTCRGSVAVNIQSIVLVTSTEGNLKIAELFKKRWCEGIRIFKHLNVMTPWEHDKQMFKNSWSETGQKLISRSVEGLKWGGSVFSTISCSPIDAVTVILFQTDIFIKGAWINFNLGLRGGESWDFPRKEAGPLEYSLQLFAEPPSWLFPFQCGTRPRQSQHKRQNRNLAHSLRK